MIQCTISDLLVEDLTKSTQKKIDILEKLLGNGSLKNNLIRDACLWLKKH